MTVSAVPPFVFAEFFDIGGINSNLSTKNLAISDVIESNENFKIITSTTRIYGNILSIYFLLEVQSNGYGVVKQKYCPSKSLVVGSLLSENTPYLPVGSIWIYRNGDIRVYGAEPEKQYYVELSWVIN